MLRMFAITAMVALALPTLALAEEHHPGPGGAHPAAAPHPHPAAPPHGGGAPRAAFRPAPHGPGPAGPGAVHPAFAPHPGGPPVGMAGPHPGGPGGHFSYHGHDFARVHVNPFVYPQGYGYQRWAIGAALPPIFFARDYWYTDWAALGLSPPPPGYQWVRYGPDLLLVDVNSGQVVDTAYDVFE